MTQYQLDSNPMHHDRWFEKSARFRKIPKVRFLCGAFSLLSNYKKPIQSVSIRLSKANPLP